MNKDGKNRMKIFQLQRETSAATRQRGNIMPSISIDSLHSKSILFAVNVKAIPHKPSQKTAKPFAFVI